MWHRVQSLFFMNEEPIVLHCSLNIYRKQSNNSVLTTCISDCTIFIFFSNARHYTAGMKKKIFCQILLYYTLSSLFYYNNCHTGTNICLDTLKKIQGKQKFHQKIKAKKFCATEFSHLLFWKAKQQERNQNKKVNSALLCKSGNICVENKYIIFE